MKINLKEKIRKMDLAKLFRLKTFIDNVSSTNVKKIKYDTVTKDMTVQFNDNTVYTYFNVPEAIYDVVLEGMSGTLTQGPWGSAGTYPSIGAALHAYVIEGGYQYKKGGNIN